MTLAFWLKWRHRRNTSAKNGQPRGRKQGVRCARPWLEALEERSLLSVGTHLDFLQQPTDALAGQSINPSVTVVVKDQFNKIVSSFNGPISLAIQDNPAGGTLGGTSAVNARTGVAGFDVAIDQAGTGYTLTASVARLLPTMGLSIGSGGSGEIEALAFHWDEKNAGRVNMDDFQVMIDAASADPGLVVALARGTRLPQVVLHVRTADPDQLEYLTYKFTDVWVSSYETSSTADRPVQSLSLNFTRIEEIFRTFNPDGTPASTRVTQWDRKASRGDHPAITGTALVALPATGLIFKNSVSSVSNELEVKSWNWGEKNAMGRVGTMEDFNVTLQAGSADAQLWAACANGQHIPEVVLHVRQSSGDGMLEYLTYKFTDVLVSSYQTSSGGDRPVESLSLNFAKIEETYRTINPDGTLASTVVTQWDRKSNRGDRPPITGTALVAPPATGLTFKNSVSSVSNELEVKSWNWGEKNAMGGIGTMQDFNVTLQAGSADAQLWAACANGQHIPEVVLHVRQSSGDGMQEYLTYKFTDVLVSSYQTSSGGDRPIESLSLNFAKIEETYRTINPDGTLASTVVTQWDRKSNRGDRPPITGTALPASPAMGLTFKNSVSSVSNELQVQSWNWSEKNAMGRVGTMEDFDVTLQAGSAGAQLWAACANGQHIPEVILHVRQSSGDGLVEYLTYKFTDVLVSSYQTISGSDRPVESLTLNFAKIEETYRTINPDGTLASTVVTQWDRKSNRGDRPQITGTALPALPATGLIFKNSVSSVSNELEVKSWNWGEKNALGRVGTMQDFNVTLQAGSADAQLWAACANGQHIQEVVVHVRQLSGDGMQEYLTYKFTDVLVSSYQTNGGGDRPVESLSLNFAKIEETYRTINPDGTLASTVLTQWDRKTNRGDHPPITGTALPAPPATGLTFKNSVSSVSNELEVKSWNWGESNPAGRVTMQDFNVTLQAGSAGAQLWAACANGQHIPEVVLHVRQSSGDGMLEYLTYKFTDVLVSSYQTSSGGDLPVESLSLNFAKIEETYRTLNPDGTLAGPVVGQWDRQKNTGGGVLVVPALPVLTTESASFAIRNPVPTTEQLSTVTAQEGSPGFTLTVAGSRFIASSIVQWNGMSLPTVLVDSTHLQVQLGASLLSEEGQASVSVFTPGPGGGSSSSQTFTITDAPLTASGNDFTTVVNQPDNNQTVATFLDANLFSTIADFRATISWGDGEVSSGIIALDANHVFYVLGSHLYQVAGTFSLTVSIIDAGGSTALVQPLVRVLEETPTEPA